MKMWILNLGRPVEVPNLSEAMAIELGANLLGESIIFGIAAGLLFLEYSRQVRKEATKEEARLEEMTSITSSIKELYFQTEKQDAQLREVLRLIHDLEAKVDRISHRPFGPRQDPSNPKGLDDVSSPDEANITDFSAEPDVNFNGGTILSALDYVTCLTNRHYR